MKLLSPQAQWGSSIWSMNEFCCNYLQVNQPQTWLRKKKTEAVLLLGVTPYNIIIVYCKTDYKDLYIMWQLIASGETQIWK